MRFKLFILFGVLLCSFVAKAQTNYEDVVYLKNGSIIHGMIIEQIPNVSIKIKSGPNVFVYKMDEIDKMTKEEVKGSSTGIGNDFGFRSKGFAGDYEIGLSDYPKGGNVAMFSIMLVNGFHLGPYFTMGLGVGAEISTKDVFNFPVYADMRAYFTKTRVAPFFNMGMGYNAMLQKVESYGYYYYYSTSETDVYHGFMFNPAFGARVAISKKIAATFSLGYKYVGSVIKTDTYNGTERDISSNHAVTLRFGVGL